MKVNLKLLMAGLVIPFILWGCQSSKTVSTKPVSTPAPSADTLNYTLVYLIHGDANYLYHDEQGKARQSDRKKVKEAVEIAREAKKGEVFIFHQRPEKKMLWLFPQKDRRLYHFRGGELIHKVKYSPDSPDTAYTAEADLFKKYRSTSKRNILLYFGHEIPQGNHNISYHSSRPQATFNLSTFAQGIEEFLPSAQEEFDLTVLSTCDNGTPEMAATMASSSNTMLASPKNLHLSHIDSDSLLKLEKEPDISALQLAESLADDTYQRLSGFIQTTITLSVYNLQDNRNRIKHLQKSYSNYSRQYSTKRPEVENSDCAELPFWDPSLAPKVESLYYRPPRFGKNAGHKTFSGWGCQE